MASVALTPTIDVPTTESSQESSDVGVNSPILKSPQGGPSNSDADPPNEETRLEEDEQNDKSTFNFLALPPELQIQIICLLPFSSLFQLRCVNKSLSSLATPLIFYKLTLPPLHKERKQGRRTVASFLHPGEGETNPWVGKPKSVNDEGDGEGYRKHIRELELIIPDKYYLSASSLDAGLSHEFSLLVDALKLVFPPSSDSDEDPAFHELEKLTIRSETNHLIGRVDVGPRNETLHLSSEQQELEDQKDLARVRYHYSPTNYLTLSPEPTLSSTAFKKVFGELGKVLRVGQKGGGFKVFEVLDYGGKFLEKEKREWIFRNLMGPNLKELKLILGTDPRDPDDPPPPAPPGGNSTYDDPFASGDFSSLTSLQKIHLGIDFFSLQSPFYAVQHTQAATATKPPDLLVKFPKDAIEEVEILGDYDTEGDIMVEFILLKKVLDVEEFGSNLRSLILSDMVVSVFDNDNLSTSTFFTFSPTHLPLLTSLTLKNFFISHHSSKPSEEAFPFLGILFLQSLFSKSLLTLHWENVYVTRFEEERVGSRGAKSGTNLMRWGFWKDGILDHSGVVGLGEGESGRKLNVECDGAMKDWFRETKVESESTLEEELTKRGVVFELVQENN